MVNSKLHSLDEQIRHKRILFSFFLLIKFKVLPVNVRCLVESENRNHVYVALISLVVFTITVKTCQRVLDFHNNEEPQPAISSKTLNQL